MDTQRLRPRFGFQAKVLILVVAVMLVGGAFTSWIVNRRIARQLDADVEEELKTSDAVFHNLLDIHARNLLLRYENVPKDPRFKAVSQLADSSTMQYLLREMLQESGADILFYTAAQGQALGSISRDAALNLAAFESGSALSRARALDGQPNVDTVSLGQRLFDVISIPAKVDGHILGVLTVGAEIGNVIAKEFRQLTGNEIVFIARDHVVGSTMQKPELFRQFIEILSRSPAGLATEKLPDPQAIQKVSLLDRDFVCLVGHFSSLGKDAKLGYLVFSSYEEALYTLRATQRTLVLVGFLVALLSTAIMWAAIRKITQPLRQLRDGAEAIGQGDFSQRVSVSTQDECGELAQAFNRMAENLNCSRQELGSAHKQLVESSRQAGMAEVATGVLHNVGNVLNSVNVSTTLVCDRVRKSKMSNLLKTASLLREHPADLGSFLTSDPKGKLLPPYLISLAEHLSQEQADVLKELELLGKNIQHIKEIVAMQQSYAKVSGIVEPLPATELVEDALRMNAAAFSRHGIQVVRQYQEVPPVAIDKHKVLQILVNLLRNAKYALEEATRTEKRLTLGIGSDGNGKVRITVQDNGIGIAQENLTRIFSHGFTTKRDGHGFGLHSGALAAKEMGGSLKAHSEGLGQGATFTLELPITKRKDEP